MNQTSSPEAVTGEHARSRLTWRAVTLFINFFLIILAYYHIKSASRSLFVEFLGADRLPYVWIGTAVFLGAVIGFYNRLVVRHSRLNVVEGTCLTFIVLLVLFRFLLEVGHPVTVVSFYIFVDIFSVVLVEQFWSLANTIYTSEQGKRWYGFVGTGGLAGGVAGGAISGALLDQHWLSTQGLLIVSAAILGLVFVLNLVMGRMGLYQEIAGTGRKRADAGVLQTLLESRYLMLIAAILLLSQLCESVVEFQFMKSVQAAYQDLDARTSYVSWFYSVLGVFSIGINLVITPLVHRFLGIMAGLLAQPLLLGVFSVVFMLHPVLSAAAPMKISDRGLSYSINRASKELLYIPVDPVLTYQAKAWIDMFGYRVFKVLGSVLILILSVWRPLNSGMDLLSCLTILVCAVWIAAVFWVCREYVKITALPAPA